MSTRDVNFNININTTSVNVINKIADKVDNIQVNSEKIAKNFTGLQKVGNALVKINQLSDFIGRLYNQTAEYINANKAQQEAEAKLARVMRNTMGATEEQFEAIKRLTAAQQALGVIGDEVQLAGAQELSTYLSKKDSLESLLPVMNDMLAQQYGLNATQESAVNIATMLGKVMDGQVGALSRYGYRFDEAQEKILKYGTEEERVATLAEVVGASVGGMNAALASTPEGKMQQIANSIGDIKERVGNLITQLTARLMPVFEAVLNKINSIVTFASKGSVQLIGGAIATALSIGRINMKLKAMAVSEGVCAAGFGAVAIAAKSAMKAISTAIKSVPIFGWIVAGISLVIGAIKLLWEKSEVFRGVILGIKEVFAGVFEWIGSIVRVIIRSFRVVVNVFKTIIGIFKLAFKVLFSPIINLINNLKSIIFNMLEKLVGWLGKIFNPIITLWNKLTGKVVAKFNVGYEKGKANPNPSMSQLNFGGIGAGGGVDTDTALGPAKSTRDEAVSGGTRSNVINITLGKMIENVVFQGSFDDNESTLQSKVEECLMRTLNAAMSVG